MLYFPITPNWRPEATKYPSVYLVDMEWHNRPNGTAVERFSYTATTTGSPMSHGAKTLDVLRNIAANLPMRNITLISVRRNNLLGDSIQFVNNIPEAIESIRFMSPLPGSVVVINLSPSTGNSVLVDPYIGQQLVKLTQEGCVVLVSAGNENRDLTTSSMPTHNNVVVASGFSQNDEAEQAGNYGDGVTCYMPVPIDINITTKFGLSSAATAQLAGVVLLMQNYALSRKRFLTAMEVKAILSLTGDHISLRRNGTLIYGLTPTWPTLERGINDKLPLHP